MYIKLNNYQRELEETIACLYADLYQLAWRVSCTHFEHIARRLHIAVTKYDNIKRRNVK